MRYAFRQLTKNPRFAALAMLTLALGIGVNTTTFSLVYALLYRLPPYPDPKSIVYVYASDAHDTRLSQSPANIHDELAAFTVFERATPVNFVTSNLARPGEPAYRVNGLQVGGDFFAILGVAPLMGRTLAPPDDRKGHNDVVVVSEAFWRDKLGANPAALGTVLRLDAKPVTVVGVMPASFQDMLAWGPVDTWQPLGYDSWTDRTNTWLNVIARVKPGVGPAGVKAQLDTIAARLAHDFPDTNAGHGLNAVSYQENRAEGARTMSWTIMGLMLSVLLIACVNLANLQLARTATRVREFAVRIALGASRGQLIRHLLSESVLLSVAGGALGLLVAVWGNRLLGSRLRMGPDAAGFDLPLAYPVLGFTFAASVVTGVLFGLMPALVASRTNVSAALKQGGRGSSGDRGKHRMRQALVVAELALALALLAGAGFFVRGIQKVEGTAV
jgi:predicted permease